MDIITQKEKAKIALLAFAITAGVSIILANILIIVGEYLL